ncbi:MAG TPA: hypothetical protein VMR50_14780 [Myxococcota bacterium]|nr:hypothetical protein [Myxococcota bacterium]
MTLRRLGWAALLAVLAVVVAEALVRAFAPQVLQHDVPELWVRDAALGWRHRPDVDLIANTGERDVEICIDALGDRVDCHKPARTDCAKRILWLGDFEALSIPFQDTVWAKLEADTGACTYAAGVGSYYMGQYVGMARERLRDPAAPHYDLVMLAVYVGNDFTPDPELIPPAQDVQWRPYRLFPASLSQQGIWDWFYPYNAWLESHSQAYVAGRAAIRRALDPGDVGVYGVPDPLLRSRVTPALFDGTAKGIALVAQEAHAHGARFLVVMHPFRSQVLDPKGEKLVHALPKLAGDIDMDQPSREIFRRLATYPEIDRAIDLLPVLRAHASPDLWEPVDAHLSAAAYQLWFETVRQPVRELLAEGPPDR